MRKDLHQWALQDSDLRHADYESAALTAELRAPTNAFPTDMTEAGDCVFRVGIRAARGCSCSPPDIRSNISSP